MTYQPIIPSSGFAGWAFLNRTMATQKAAFTSSAEIQRNEEYFREKIGGISTAEELVGDRRLLGVALGAFGLEDDIDNKYFIRRVLEEGSLDPKSLANKLSDKRYLALTKAFGFGDFDTPRTVLSYFPDEVLTKYEARSFEAAVGNADGNMRLALALQRDLPELAGKNTSEKTKWYTIIGSSSLSSVFKKALSLPDSVGSLDVDQQLSIYSQKAEAIYGSSDPAQFADSDKLETLTRDFLLRSQLSTVSSISSGNAALMLLQNAGRGNGLSLLL